jgi:hypothetical protein
MPHNELLTLLTDDELETIVPDYIPGVPRQGKNRSS